MSRADATKAAISLRPVDPEADAALLHGWVSDERAAYWGMLGLDVQQVAEIYTYIDSAEHLAAYLLLDGGTPLGLAQTYDPSVDEIGDFYDRRPGDVGMHLLLADDPGRAGRTAALVDTFLGFLFADPDCGRVVFEPDARNLGSAALLERIGATRGPLVDLRTSISEKPAQFWFLDRPDG